MDADPDFYIRAGPANPPPANPASESNRVKTSRIGVISDTHGLLRPEALAALRGSDYIIHAGDIGDLDILKKLAAVAPVTAIRGNVDRERLGKEDSCD